MNNETHSTGEDCTRKPGRWMLSFWWDGRQQCTHRVGERAIRDLLALVKDDPRCTDWALFGTDGKIKEHSENWLPF